MVEKWEKGRVETGGEKNEKMLGNHEEEGVPRQTESGELHSVRHRESERSKKGNIIKIREARNKMNKQFS